MPTCAKLLGLHEINCNRSLLWKHQLLAALEEELEEKTMSTSRRKPDPELSLKVSPYLCKLLIEDNEGSWN